MSWLEMEDKDSLDCLQVEEYAMDNRFCELCEVADAKYVCPRCNIFYCSVKCYQDKNHSQCSEEFYKKSVLEYLNTKDRDTEDIRKVQKILQEFDLDDQQDEENKEQDSLDSDDEEDIAQRLVNVSLDDADTVWKSLSASEKQDFIDLVKNGYPETLVPIWVPWWMFREPEVLVKEVGEASGSSLSYVSNCPALKDMPSFSSLSRQPPSPCIKWNIINVMGSYSYVARFFNGEPEDFSCEAVNFLIMLSGNLQYNQNYEGYDSAINQVAYEILQCSWLDGSESAITRMRDDVSRILFGPDKRNSSFYLLAALSDILDLLNKAKGDMKAGQKRKMHSTFYKQFEAHNPICVIAKEKIKHCEKKVEYYLSWVKSVAS